MLNNAQMKNPFYHRTPVQDPAYFFGRTEELRQLCSLVVNGQSISVVGPRRIGKSSLLAQLLQPAVQAAHGLDRAGAIMVYFNGEAWQDQPPEVVYAALWAAIADAVAAVTGQWPTGKELPVPTVGKLEFPHFQRAVRQLTMPDRMLVLLLDEFDALSRNRNLDEFFFSSLRSLTTQGIGFVTTSAAPLIELTFAQQSALSSPFFNIFLPQRLGLLSLREAHQLLAGTAAHGEEPLTAAEQEQILQMAGPHPGFLQIAAYHYWRTRQATSIECRKQLHQSFLEEITPHWSHQWHYLATAEKRALGLLAVRQPESSVLRLRLQQSCLVQKKYGALTYLSPLLRSFIHRQPIHQLVQTGTFLIDRESQQAWLHDKPLTLTPQDFRLLMALALQTGHPPSNRELASRVWANEERAINQKNRLKSAVSNLRRKLGTAGQLIIIDAAGHYQLMGDEQ